MTDGVLLKVEDLTIALPKGADRTNAVQDVSFAVRRGETLCIIGESGSGKSLTASAIMGLLPSGLRPTAGTVEFEGADLLRLPEAQMRSLRGRRLGMIFQEPMTALNPIMSIRKQLREVFGAHARRAGLDGQDMEGRLSEALRKVGLVDADRILDSYPFRLSGGQRQRVMIAMALLLKPSLLIADEPTTALDVTTQAQVLALLKDLQAENEMGLVFITHDFGVVADIADRVAVMQEGVIVEIGTRKAVLGKPQAPYTQKLIRAVPHLDLVKRAAIPEAPLLQVSGLTKTYQRGVGFFGRATTVAALKNANLTVNAGETVGVIGESGSGKSTLARCVARLFTPTSGTIRFDGTDISRLSRSALKPVRRRMQMVFQDPYASLNPRRTVGEIIAQVMVTHGTDAKEARHEAERLLTVVGLGAHVAQRYPHEFSGGQRQRVGIARALALRPQLLIADEPVSALDVSVQAQVLKLLKDLKDQFGLTMLFITHDLRVASQICDRLIVMKAGEIVEEGPTASVLVDPRHAYTRELLEAVPGRDWERERQIETTAAS